ncbi:cellulase family glycosylhydrolase [Robbsia sp. Bb-Pol-6]|uniref:Cellulase family glycosylhydrolase n=1 Tax=Robbsia betulipollinis TaxID=2981849 RepID=A0ABT3ZJR3_9BURK|nr:cellulase family glycosylhydrolase [Robbsia betulipollinis]MCY0386773.1 cellulase family glycosylhydrolase [Robbsia betulipollinis]
MPHHHDVAPVGQYPGAGIPKIDAEAHPIAQQKRQRTARTTLRPGIILVSALASLLGMASGAHAANGLLSARDHAIVDASGHTVQLTGFNLGGWFVMESFMSPMDRTQKLRDAYGVMTTLDRRFGAEQARALMRDYARSWITTSDIRAISAAGYNLVRIPLWWGQFFDLDNPTPSGWRADAFDVLDDIVRDCRAHGLYAILDMHGVVGSQSPASNTGQAGRNAYWTDPAAQAQTDWMWSRIASHYRGNATIAGYDVINEPAPPQGMPARPAVWHAYDRLYTAIRAVDPDHMIFLEGAFGKWDWSMLPDPRTQGWTNVVYEMHVYRWPQPGEDRAALAQAVAASAAHAVADFHAHADWHVPGYIGEFNGFDTGAATWRHLTDAYSEAGLNWSMWSYKAVNGVAPNHWGYQDPRRWPARPDPATDTAADIRRDWRNWTTEATFAVNPAIGLRMP